MGINYYVYTGKSKSYLHSSKRAAKDPIFEVSGFLLQANMIVIPSETRDVTTLWHKGSMQLYGMYLYIHGPVRGYHIRIGSPWWFASEGHAGCLDHTWHAATAMAKTPLVEAHSRK